MTQEPSDNVVNEILAGRRKKRRRLVAVVFSFFIPGLGQIYCGKLRRGVIFISIWLAYEFLILGLLAFLRPAYINAVGPLLSCTWIITITAVVDSFLLARKTGEDHKLKAYNRWYVYPLVVAIVVLISLGSALVFRSIVMEAFKIPTNSNYPTIVDGDRILAKKYVYFSGKPQRGDMVVFHAPDIKEHYIQRVIAVAGDVVEMKDGELYVNGQKLMRKHIRKDVFKSEDFSRTYESEGDIWLETNGKAQYRIFWTDVSLETLSNFNKTPVPENQIFVLGDNRSHSIDSRYFGPIGLDSIIGRADYIYQRDGSLSNIRQIDPK